MNGDSDDLIQRIVSFFAISLALLSGEGHNLADALALVFSWYALRMARRPADARQRYGYHRVGIPAALVNAVSPVVIALYIFREGMQLCSPPTRSKAGRRSLWP